MKAAVNLTLTCQTANRFLQELKHPLNYKPTIRLCPRAQAQPSREFTWDYTGLGMS
jgi:hypothetical protein